MPPNPQARVLAVDDDEDACEMLQVLLESHGIDAKCVRSVAAAKLALAVETFDLYLLDSWLPQVDGFEFCRQLRASDSHTPIVFYSGAAYDTDKQRGLAAGANGYVAKPDVEALIETISNLIANARTEVVGRDWEAARGPSPERASGSLSLSAHVSASGA
jgi:DNA-binding response OmpR family regulator